jgi:zinc/manganese transport system ATP-binding protein
MPAGQIALQEVTVRYGRQVALQAVSGFFAAGSLTAVVGANGSGKSTLLGVIAGTVRPSDGKVVRSVERLAHLPQVSLLDRDFPLSVAELIALGGWREFGVFGKARPSVRAGVEAAAQTVGLADRLDRLVGELSAGQLQRALFARLILQDAPAILLDEPFASVDADTTRVLLDQIQRWHKEGRTVIAVLHDFSLVRLHFPATLVLARRCVAWGPTRTVLADAAQ